MDCAVGLVFLVLFMWAVTRRSEYYDEYKERERPTDSDRPKGLGPDSFHKIPFI